MLPIIVGITGATGAIYGINLLKELKKLDIPTILVVSTMGLVTIKQELSLSAKDVFSLASKHYTNDNLSASIASGSFLTSGMIVAPTSVRTLSSIANALDDNLITRSADVVLKERRKLVLMFRETPFNLTHIKLMESITLNGGIIMPPLPAFYNNPRSIDDIVNHSVARCLDLFGIKNKITSRWGE
jgi:4-hydroxy-3-polyprenylbenzoate decarboxylase